MAQEKIHVGMMPSHPGEVVREDVLKELGLSIAKASEILGVRRATLSDLVNEKASLSPEMALRLEKAFGLSLETLLSMQAWHDGAAIRARADTVQVQPYEMDS